MVAKDEVYVATDTGVAEIKGVPFPFYAGVTRVRGDHPLVKACPLFFEPITDHLHYETESATAAPGEKRGAKA